MKDYHINIVFSQEDEGYIADIPDLPMCSVFGKTPTEVLKTIAPYMPTELRSKLLGRPDLRIRYLGYDWSLNDQAVVDGPPLPPEPVPGTEPDTSK